MNLNFLYRFRKPQSEADSTLEARRAQQIAADATAHDDAAPESTLPAPPVEEPIAAEVAETATDNESTIIDAERERYLRDPLAFGNEVLGFQLAPEHVVLLDALLDESALDVLVLWPRGSAKSTCITVAAIISILRNPNVRIFYGTSDDDLATRRGALVKSFLENPTPKFRKLFPEFCNVRGRGNEFTVSCRIDRTLVDPTFSTSPLGADPTGGHYDIIFIDDLVTKKNSEKPEQRRKVFERYQGFRGLRTASTRVVISGTIYDSDDAHSRILRAIDSEGESCHWRLDKRSVFQPRCANCQHKKIFHFANRCRLCAEGGCSCPQFEAGEQCVLIEKRRTRSGGEYGWTLEELAREQSESRMGRKLFASQFEMNASPDVGFEHVKFTPEFLQSHTRHEMLPFYPHFIVADLGLRASVRANPTVLMAFEVFNGTAYPVSCNWGRWGAKEVEDALFDFLNKHNWCPLFMENIGAFEFLRNNISKRACAIPNLQIVPIPVDNQPDAKMRRIANLHAAMIESKIGLYRHMRGYEILARQLGQAPRIRPEDDFADTLAQGLWVCENNPPVRMPAIIGREPVVEPAPSATQILSPAERAVAEAMPIVGILWIDSLLEERRSILQLSAQSFDGLFVTNNRAVAEMGWNCQQPVIGVANWYEEYAAHPAIVAAKKIWIVLPSGAEEQNQKFLNALAASSLKDRCFVITRPEVPRLFSARLSLQRASRYGADALFETLFPSVPLAAIDRAA